MADRPGSILSATLWMFVLSILLFWMPVLGPLIAGYVGEKKAGSFGNAILEAIMPGLMVGGVIFFFSSLLTGLPLLGLIGWRRRFGTHGGAFGPTHFRCCNRHRRLTGRVP